MDLAKSRVDPKTAFLGSFKGPDGIAYEVFGVKLQGEDGATVIEVEHENPAIAGMWALVPYSKDLLENSAWEFFKKAGCLVPDSPKPNASKEDA